MASLPQPTNPSPHDCEMTEKKRLELEAERLEEQQMEEYCRAVGESEGFGDIPHFPDCEVLGLITPMINFHSIKYLQEHAEEAIQHYNKENDTNYEVVEVVKANTQPTSGIMYYITFEVKKIGTPPNHPTITFQAKIYDGVTSFEIEFCRPKPF